MESQSETVKEIVSKIEDLKETDLLRVLNGSYLAQRFFGKSKGWFSQKLNRHVKNGVPCRFTESETKILRNALYTLSIELQEIADGLQ